ncbi:hypothetical protein [Levilactobacillus suantsaii]|uniref:hypothetical protein n=1 Tax=Levilactobacillus suantsaii TaxID=2292255 RepID=UPI00148354A5|nr:hypothetical protein [Levilactobacillus suantsaii]
MNLKRVITGLGVAIVMLAIVSGLSWFLTGRGSLQAHSQPMDHPPMAREVPQQRAD